MNTIELKARRDAFNEALELYPKSKKLKQKIYDCNRRILILERQRVMNSHTPKRTEVLLDIDTKLAQLDKKHGVKYVEKA